MKDKELYDGMKMKDPKVYQWIYNQMFSSIETMVKKNSGTSDDARDLFQEGLVSLWLNIRLDKYQLQSGVKLSTYFYQLCKNKWISELRKKKIDRTEWKDDFDTEEVIVDTSDEERITNVEHALKQLGAACQELLERFYYRKESLRVISLQLGYTEKTAKNNKYRCMQKLKTILSSQSDAI